VTSQQNGVFCISSNEESLVQGVVSSSDSRKYCVPVEKQKRSVNTNIGEGGCMINGAQVASI